MKKNVAVALSILFSVVMLALGTYSYIKWSSIDQNTAINYVVDASLKDYIEYDPGNSQFAGDFKVVDSYSEGIKSTVTVNKTSLGEHVNLFASLKMTVNEIGANMAKYEGVKWTVTSKDCANGTTTSTEAVCAEGNFLGVTDGETLILKPNIELSTNVKEFTVWLWADASETPTSSMIHEKVDTEIWMEIGQEVTETCAVTQIGANNQIISATGLCPSTDITYYAVTTSNSTPSYWMTIPTSDQNNIYNLVTNKKTTGTNAETSITTTGTYYVWFKDSAGTTFYDQVSVTAIDTVGPTCTFVTTKDTIRSGEQTTIKLRCTDDNSRIVVTDTNKIELSEITKTANSSLLTLNSISEPKSISNGVEYTITVTGNAGSNGTVTLTLPASSITNKNGIGNTLATGTINIENTFSISYYRCNGTKFSTDYSNATPTSYVYGTGATLSTPTKTGYTFTNYYSTPECDDYTISSIKTTDFGDKKLYAKWSTNTYNISYNLKNGTHGSKHPTSAEYDDVIEISNPSKTVTVTGNANGTGATVGAATSKAQPFIGWGPTNTNTSTAYAGTTSTNLTLWSVDNKPEEPLTPGTSSTFFKNLNPTNNSTVTLTANYTPTAFNLPTVTKTGYVCGWNTSSTGTTIQYASAASYTPEETSSASITMYAVCVANKVTITLKENGSNATTTGYSVSLSTSSTSDTATFSGTTSGATIAFESTSTTNALVAGTTYYIWAGKSSQAKTTKIYSGVSFTAAANTTQTATINYYGLTLAKGTGISAVSNGGTSSTSEIQYLYNSSSKQAIAINATLSSCYNWSTWTKTSGTTLSTVTLATKSQSVKMGAGKATYTASGTKYGGSPTVTISGDMIVDNTLTANVTCPSGLTCTYQWYRKASSGTSGGTAISGATELTYTLTTSDLGKYIYFIATPSDTTCYTATSVQATDEFDDGNNNQVHATYTYTATFNANGAAKATRSCTDTTTASSGSCTVTAYTLTSSDYDSTAYTFNGWDKVTTDGTKDADAGATITLTGNVTYEAMLSIKDQSCPAITFSTNGNTTWAKSHSTTITATDATGVSTLKYLWSTSSSASVSSGTTFTSGSTITKSTNTGNYYLCVYASDTLGNSCDKVCSNAFYFDNTTPTDNTPSTICLAKGTGTQTVSDLINATDAHSGIKTPHTVSPSTISKSTTGSTAISYTIEDNATNSTSGTATVQVHSSINPSDLVVTSGDGLYADSKASGRYIFKGTDPNNYISFNGQTWRILAIEADGTYKIIYPGTDSNLNKAFHSGDVDVFADTDMYTYLNGEYYNSLNESAKNAIQSHSFNTGQMGLVRTNTNYYLSDILTREANSTTTANVGLQTLSDFLRISTNSSCTDSTSIANLSGANNAYCRNNNWLYTNGYEYWTIISFSTGYEWFITTSGGIKYADYPTEAKYVRPVVYLKNTTTFTGSGTSSDPYVISECSAPSEYTCTISATTGYQNPQTLTITAYNSSGTSVGSSVVDYSFDNSTYNDTNTKSVTAAGTYVAYIKDSQGYTNSCSITLSTQEQWRSRSCAVALTYSDWSLHSTTYSYLTCYPYSKGEAEANGSTWYRTCEETANSYCEILFPASSGVCDVEQEYSRDCSCSSWGSYGSWSATELSNSCGIEVQSRTAYGVG